MKSVKITYHCDYCKRQIDPDVDVVMAIMPGRIGYQDSFLPDSEDSIQHYHDYCLEYLLTLEFEPEEDLKKEDPEPPKEEEEPEAAPKKKSKGQLHKNDYYGPVKPGVKDLGALKALLDAGWTKQECANEFQVHISTIYNWIKEMGGEINEYEDQPA